MLDPVKTEPALIDQVHDQLVEAISVGRLAPGERLTQARVAALLDVSRQPVSHALQLLKHRGLVTGHGKRGLAVAPLDGMRIWQLYQIREALDGLAARLAAERISAGLAGKREIANVQKVLQAGISLDPAAETIELVRADVNFHRALHELSGNPEIASTVSEQWPQFMRSMATVLDAPERKISVWAEHEQIVEAVVSGDGDEAQRLAGAHANRAGKETRDRLADRDRAFGV